MGIARQLRNRVRFFNRRVLNRLVGRFAGRGHGRFALVRHVGRRSGKSYETPIIVTPADGDFVVALTYGPEVDWYRNLLAAGGCRVLWHGSEHQVSAIEPMAVEAARRLFPQPERLILRLLRVRHFVRMRYHVVGEPSHLRGA